MKTDTKGILMANLGNILATHWMVWSNINYGDWGSHITTYITSMGGLI